MSIESIINFIDNKSYINIHNNEISYNNYFKGDIEEFNEYKKDDINIINVFKKKYINKFLFPTDYSIIIIDNDNNNDYRIFISYKIENDELYWIIKIL